MAKAKTSITTENRSGSAADAAAKEQRTEMPLSDLHPFEGHPFKVLDDELMEQTVESIKQIGVVSPLIVRPDPEGGFEILSGHRRLHAAQLAGLETVPVIVKEMDDDAAIIFMVDSNLQRENILPSERAFSYKMKLEAMKHQGERGDLTSAQVGPKSWAAQVVAEEAGDSKSQVKRFIRLTNLIPEILDMVDSIFAERMKSDPQAGSNFFSRWRQKQAIKKEYAAAKNTAAGTAKAAQGTASMTEKAFQFVQSHSHIIIGIVAVGLLVLVIAGSVSSCSVLINGGGNVVLGTSYTAEDEDLKGVETDYTKLEDKLRKQIDRIETDHPGYDEYRYNLAEIGHNPYELASLLTVEFENYTRSQVQARLQSIFDAQYELKLEEKVEIRTRKETRVGYSYNPITGTGHTYTYQVTVQYEYKILNVTLLNRGVDYVARNSGLTDDQLQRYEVTLECRGNRDDLFAGIAFATPDGAGSSGEYQDYDIPGEALTDEKFRKMITEAEKYLGYPYVWGGSSPSTSFDCSGFVSWVINHCGNGWNVGRQTANGLMGKCDIIPKSEAKPGDLIFFQKTYNTSGASHVGIYVGNGMMIHCGNPISYASIETNYWRQHYYCMGRIR